MPEKLLTIKEVAGYLSISEEEVKRLVDIGEIPAYRIGDTFLRFRKEQIDAIRSEIRDFENAGEGAQASRPPDAASEHMYTDLERDIKLRQPDTRQYDYTPGEKLRDFIYFNDFYILSFVIIAILMYFIIFY